MKTIVTLLALCSALLLSGCAKQKPYDYSAFRASRPASILVLPAANSTPDVNAAHSFVSGVTAPLAEAGYYVFPVALVEETFKQNGLTNAEDIRNVSTAKLHEIFNADAALYIDVTDYGSRYMVFRSVTQVVAKAKLVDLRSGTTLWQGSGAASDDNSNNGGNILGAMITAAVKQVANNLQDRSHDIALIAGTSLLATNDNGGLLPGPRRKIDKS